MFSTNASLLISDVFKDKWLDLALDLLSKIFVFKSFETTIEVKISISNVTMAYHNTIISDNFLGFNN